MNRLCLILALCLLATEASAMLIDRGNGLIYDTEQDITWLWDANYAKTSGWAAVNATPAGTPVLDRVFSDGRMSWKPAMRFAEELVYAGFDDWRLPKVAYPDPDCSIVQATRSYGFDCTRSEFGHLMNVDGITLGNPGPFVNIDSFISIYEVGVFWTHDPVFTEPPESTHHWCYTFDKVEDQPGTYKEGWQGSCSNGTPIIPWVVRDGDVNASTVSEPGNLLLLGIGLVLLFSLQGRVLRHPD